jgi:hypothetical protein
MRLVSLSRGEVACGFEIVDWCLGFKVVGLGKKKGGWDLRSRGDGVLKGGALS